jgi:hypothetical protein
MFIRSTPRILGQLTERTMSPMIRTRARCENPKTLTREIRQITGSIIGQLTKEHDHPVIHNADSYKLELSCNER